jgi:hypothetical protein
LGAIAWRRRARRGALFAPPERLLVVALIAVIAACVVAMALTQPPDEIFALGLRYTSAIIPFMVMLTAILVAKVGRDRWRVWTAWLLVLGLTRAGGLAPWTFWAAPRAKPDPDQVVTFHNPPGALDRAFNTEQFEFARSLVRDNPGTIANIAAFLNAHASPTDVVVTNYGWEPLYFHTHLAQGMTVLSSYPIYGAAKARGLPDYVFSAQGARWIVWRQAWGSYRGQALDQVLAELAAARIPTTLVARIPETLWENRENIHFRRFPGGRYIFPWYGQLPDALIYRIDWPRPPA